MGNGLASRHQPVTDLLPLSEIIAFLGIEDVHNVRLASHEGERGATDALKLKHMNCESMELSGESVTNDQVKFLVESGILKHQKELIIYRSHLTAEGFAYLSGLNVEAISLMWVPIITNTCLDYLAQMPSLKSVLLSEVSTEISIPHATMALRHLESFSVIFTDEEFSNCRIIGIGDLAHLGEMHAIKSLALQTCASGMCLKHIASSVGEQLVALNVHFLKISDYDVRTIASMRFLRSLKLSSRRMVSFPSLSPLTDLEKLETLEIYTFSITVQFLIDTVRSMPYLRHLTLGNCSMDYEIWERIGSLHALKTLKILDCCTPGLPHLHHMSSLETLSLVRCYNLLEEDIRELVRNVASLRYVYLWKCGGICSTFSSSVRDGLFCPGVAIKVYTHSSSRICFNDFSVDEIKKWSDRLY